MDSIQKSDRSEAPFDAGRMASLVANGDVELPIDLPDVQLRQVVELVRKQRRLNLLKHIARCLAADITHSSRRTRDD